MVWQRCVGVIRDEQVRWVVSYAKKIERASTFVEELWKVYLELCLAKELKL